MTEVVLINPNYEGSFFHLPIQCYPPLGLAYLASSLLKEGIETKIIDARALNLEEKEVARRVNKLNPRIVGIYTTSFTLRNVVEIIDEIKKRLECKIVVGGPHITHSPHDITTINADFGIIGDGEISFVEFVKRSRENKIKKINGLVFKKNKRIQINSVHNLSNLDLLPFPARDLLPNKLYFSPLHGGRITTLITSRGCPFDCIFCGLPNKGRYRERSVNNVLSEIEELENEGFEYIEIEDDCFTLNKRRVEKICRGIIEKKIKIEWGCETRIDCLNRKLIKLMKKAGCINIRFGIESGNEKIRKFIVGKNFNNKKVRKVLKMVKENGILAICYFMFGLPSENLKSMKDTLNFALEINPDMADFHLPIPIPGSRLFEISVKEGKIREDCWGSFAKGGSLPVYIPYGLTFEYLRKMQRYAYKKFYGNLFKISTLIRKIRNFYGIVTSGKEVVNIHFW